MMQTSGHGHERMQAWHASSTRGANRALRSEGTRWGIQIWILAFSAVLGVCAAQHATVLDSPDSQLMSCYGHNTNQQQQGATFKAFIDSEHPWLRLHKVFWSPKQPCTAHALDPNTAGNPVWMSTHPDGHCVMTVVTTLTPSRLENLRQLCASWPGPLSAAMYVALEQPAGTQGLTPENEQKLANATRTAEEFFNSMESHHGACALRLLVMYEILFEQAMHLVLPINSLRNVALLASSTPLVSMIDVDLAISATLGQQLVTGPEKEVQARCSELLSLLSGRRIFILPAMEPYTAARVDMKTKLQWADRSVAGTKDQLQDMVHRQEMCFFQELSYARGHKLTDFPRWYTSQWPYEVKWQLFYEPWFMVGRMNNPWYDVRFQGYGYNKQNHVAGLAIAGFKFMVHPDAWVVHRPHEKTAVQRLYVVALNNRAKLNKRGEDLQLPTNWTQASDLTSSQIGALLQYHVNAIFKSNMKEMRQGGYQPQIDVATQHCLSVLPWWKG